MRAVVTSLILGSIVLAAPRAARAEGTAEQRSACTGDAFRYCAGDIPDSAAIEACLRRNASQLSPACQSVMLGAPGGGAQEIARGAPGDAAPGRRASCAHRGKPLGARLERFFTGNPAGALGAAAGFAPMIAAMAQGSDDIDESALSAAAMGALGGLGASGEDCDAPRPHRRRRR
jgi:hypothetical protein